LMSAPSSAPAANGSRQGVVLYHSEVSASVASKKHTEVVRFLLQAHKIAHVEVDISLDASAAEKEYMIATSGKRTTPQVFVNGRYVGASEELQEANEDGRLKELLSTRELEEGE
jgi:glutaredoxin 3